MECKSVVPTSLVIIAAVACFIAGTAGAARDRLSGAPRLVRCLLLGSPGLTEVESLAWSPDGRRLAAAGGPVALRVWDANTGKEEHFSDDRRKKVYAVTWSPDGKLLATTEGDNTVRLWEAGTGRQIRVLGKAEPPSPRHWLCGAAWSPDGSKVAVGGSGVRIWDAATGSQEASLPAGAVSSVGGVEWSPNGRWLATAGEKSARVWDTTTWKPRPSLSAQAALALTWSHDSRRIALCSDAGTTIWVTDARTRRQLWKQFLASASPHHLGHGPATLGAGSHPRQPASPRLLPPLIAGIYSLHDLDMGFSTGFTIGCIAWNPAHNLLASGGGADRAVRIWDAENGHLQLLLGNRSGGIVYAVAWSPDGTRLASSTNGGVPCVWDLAFPGK